MLTNLVGMFDRASPFLLDCTAPTSAPVSSRHSPLCLAHQASARNVTVSLLSADLSTFYHNASIEGVSGGWHK